MQRGIEHDIPVGFDMHARPVLDDRDAEWAVPLRMRMRALMTRYETLAIVGALGRFDHRRVWNQIGTLGGGNHFIELCLDEHDRVWVMLHSGSRNIGNRIGEIAIASARRLAERSDVHLPDRDLAWLSEGSPEFERYVAGLHFAQDYAALNRDVMLHLVLQRSAGFSRAGRSPSANRRSTATTTMPASRSTSAAGSGSPARAPSRRGTVSSASSPAAWAHARSSSAARAMPIPISRAVTAPAAACPAARRGDATRRDDLAAQTAGVECRKDAAVVDELPAAYKDVDAVMAAQRDLVEVVHTLKQVLCVKG